jgi:hypothetical protein
MLGITNILARSDACLVTGIVDAYRPIGLRMDVGEVIFIKARPQKIYASSSGCQINERPEHLQRTRWWVNIVNINSTK